MRHLPIDLNLDKRPVSGALKPSCNDRNGRNADIDRMPKWVESGRWRLSYPRLASAALASSTSSVMMSATGSSRLSIPTDLPVRSFRSVARLQIKGC